jgi:predicted ester cyclase
MIEWNPDSVADAVVRRFVEAQSAQDTAAILACLDEDYVRYGEESGWLPIGKQHYQAMADNFIAAFGDFSWRLLHKVTDGDTVAFEFVESGVFCREWDLLGMKVAPNQGRYDQQTAMVCKVNEKGLIQSYSYTHDRAFMQSFSRVIAESGAIAAIPEAPEEAPAPLDPVPQPTRAVGDCSPKNAAEATVLGLAADLGRGDMDGVRRRFSDDCVWYCEEYGWAPTGKTRLCEQVAGFRRAFPDHRWEIIDLLSEGDTVAVEFVETGEFSAPWQIENRTIEPNRERYRSHRVIFFEIDGDDRISLGRAVHDGDFAQRFGPLLASAGDGRKA